MDPESANVELRARTDQPLQGPWPRASGQPANQELPLRQHLPLKMKDPPGCLRRGGQGRRGRVACWGPEATAPGQAAPGPGSLQKPSSPPPPPASLGTLPGPPAPQKVGAEEREGSQGPGFKGPEPARGLCSSSFLLRLPGSPGFLTCAPPAALRTGPLPGPGQGSEGQSFPSSPASPHNCSCPQAQPPPLRSQNRGQRSRGVPRPVPGHRLMERGQRKHPQACGGQAGPQKNAYLSSAHIRVCGLYFPEPQQGPTWLGASALALPIYDSRFRPRPPLLQPWQPPGSAFWRDTASPTHLASHPPSGESKSQPRAPGRVEGVGPRLPFVQLGLGSKGVASGEGPRGPQSPKLREGWSCLALRGVSSPVQCP
ncbi:proline-rich protein 2-like [Choloepus didactylus]|uniref:proline-rich protein 2-like n=1 Tax=Choloepus didactylus TaxID=27675 RepID=UPI0018A0274F|nr:proline-rich protein 2-like [Choloepus didactylus]